MAVPRVFISTDLRLSSEEKDDAQSLIHALLYQDKMNIVGIAGTASKWNHQDGLVGDIDKIIDVYAKDYAKLEAKHPAFKSPAELKAVSWQGATDTAPWAGWSSPTDSSKAIIAEAKKAAAAGEKLNVLTWGGGTDLAQALHDDPSIAPTIRYFNISNQDANAHNYIGKFKGKLDMWVDDMSTYRGIYQSPESSAIIKGWHQQHADGHGALGDYFAQLSGDIFNSSGVKMGDSPTVLRFLSGDLNDPSKESWGGEFIKTGTNYWTDNPSPSVDLNRSGTNGAWTIYEDRAAWLNSFAERFDWLKGGGSTPTPTPTPVPSQPIPTPTPTPAPTDPATDTLTVKIA
ncbi:nucleoside hydrolase-like domain-containing protein, partial [Microvirga arabica]